MRLLRSALRDVTVRNAGYLSLVQAASLLIPLITLPWMLRALEPEAFGRYAFALAFTQYFIILSDYGFSLAGAKRVAELRDRPDALNLYFWTIQSARAILTVAAIVIAFLLVFTVPSFRSMSGVMAASLPTLLGGILSPHWLFLGFERLALVSVATIAARAAVVPPIFLFVNGPEDAWVAALISSGNAILAGLITIIILVRSRLVGPPILPGMRRLLEAYRDAWYLFLSNLSVSLYSASNGFVLGLVSPTLQVGYFTAAERMRSVAVIPIIPISSAFYPRVSRMMMEDRQAAFRLIRRLTLALAALMATVSACLFAAAPLIVALVMGDAFTPSIEVLRVLSPIPFLVGLNTVFGTIALINLGRQREFGLILLSAGLFNIAMLIALGSLYGAVGAACALLATETIVTILMGLGAWRGGVFRREAEPA